MSPHPFPWDCAISTHRKKKKICWFISLIHSHLAARLLRAHPSPSSSNCTLIARQGSDSSRHSSCLPHILQQNKSTLPQTTAKQRCCDLGYRSLCLSALALRQLLVYLPLAEKKKKWKRRGPKKATFESQDNEANRKSLSSPGLQSSRTEPTRPGAAACQGA